MRERKEIEEEFIKDVDAYYGEHQGTMAKIQLEVLLDIRDLLYDLTDWEEGT